MVNSLAQLMRTINISAFLFSFSNYTLKHLISRWYSSQNNCDKTDSSVSSILCNGCAFTSFSHVHSNICNWIILNRKNCIRNEAIVQSPISGGIMNDLIGKFFDEVGDSLRL